MELTAHSGARPEHARWQGQLVIIRGERTKRTVDGLKVFTLKEIGYGEGDGFKGWNCRHNWHPYYPGLSTPNYTQEQLKKLDEKSIEWDGKKYTEYEIRQMQRTAERKVRALKRRALASQEAIKNAPDEDTKLVLETSYMDSAAKLKAAERQLKDFCQQTGRRNDTFRTQVQGFGRSEAQRAVQANKKHLQEQEERAIIKKIKDCGVRGTVHLTPKEIDTSKLTIDSKHIGERKHSVALEEAISFIHTAEVSISRWNGQYENYYSLSGAAYVNLKTNEIRTAFKEAEYDENTKEMMEVLKAWKKK